MRKIIKIMVFAILFPALIVSTIALTYLHFFASEDKNLSGLWTAKLDLTDQATITAFTWLQDIEAVSISTQDIKSYMQGICVDINLTLEQTAHAEGTFQCNILQESYNSCNQVAYEAFASAFRELLGERLRMAGYTGSTDAEAVETLVMEAFGMSTVSYLMTCGPNLLPSLEELQAQYEGSGTYQTANGILTRQFTNGASTNTRVENYIRKGATLILSEDFSEHSSVIYTLQETKDQLLFYN
ncbi:hypothetical protein IMSAGC011_02303 [Lachnospiraceae bacterium]|nr:hypothetical protein IMSAGC011_02303 [Lachnospiraceae bacterium]